MSRLTTLPPRERRGSRPRCVLLTDGTRAEVAERLTRLVACDDFVVRPDHRWAPEGFSAPTEVELDKAETILTEPALRESLRRWWLGHSTPYRTPKWDLVSQARFRGTEALLLVEAKAHDAELLREAAGKRLDDEATDGSVANHARIGAAIGEANAGLGAGWNLSVDARYQLSNRFAWAWRIAANRMPVVLVYLGFLNADEMASEGTPLASHDSWADLVERHSTNGVPSNAWGREHDVNGVTLLPLIRSLQIELDGRCQEIAV